jgi:hypothetical protein
MDDGALATLARAARDFVRDWRTLAGIEVFVALVSFVVITPMSEALLRVLVSRSGNAAVTDVDIALFFFTTKSGLPALLLLVAASLGITIFGQACLMTVGIARAGGGRVRVRDAVATFDMRPTLRPRSRDIPAVSVSDEFVPLNLERESLDDQPLLEK